MIPTSHLQPCAHYRGEIDAASLCRSVPPAEASHRSSLIGGDPAPLTSYLRGVFYCKVCGCADGASARKITTSDTRIGSSVNTPRARRLFSQPTRPNRSTQPSCNFAYGPTPSDTYNTKTHHSRCPQAPKSAVVLSVDRRTNDLVMPTTPLSLLEPTSACS
jgi:hypothetical protein